MFKTSEASEIWGAQEHVGHKSQAAQDHGRYKTYRFKST